MKITLIDWLFGKDGALFQAVVQGNMDMAAELISKGANVNARSTRGVTPLHRASENGHVEIARLLLEKGALQTESNDGETPLSMAEANGHADVVSLLREQAGGQ